MKIFITSDIHIKSDGDEGYLYLEKFVSNVIKETNSVVIFLGDIFDLMCGPHLQYYKQYVKTFELIRNATQNANEVIYFEGNHDLHLEKLFNQDLVLKNIKIYTEPIYRKIFNFDFYLSHGDEHNKEDVNYLRYRKWLNSNNAKFISHYLMPYSALEWLGKRASIKSRKRGRANPPKKNFREIVRSGVEANVANKVDYAIGGHTHLKDEYQLTSGGVYLNNGFARNENTYIVIDHQGYKFQALS